LKNSVLNFVSKKISLKIEKLCGFMGKCGKSGYICGGEL
jgi:hypothetical protein